jgi:hypothetical protein
MRRIQLTPKKQRVILLSIGIMVVTFVALALFAKFHFKPVANDDLPPEPVFAYPVSAYVAPNGRWALVEGIERGNRDTMWNTRSNRIEKTFNEDIRSTFSECSWAPDSHAIALRNSDTRNLAIFYPQNKSFKTAPGADIKPNLSSFNSPIVWSPDSRYLAMNVERFIYNKKKFINNVVVWDTKGRTPKLLRFEFHAKEMAWVNRNTLFLVGFKYQKMGITGKGLMALIDLHTQKLTQITIPYSGTLSKIGLSNLSPYPDENGRMVSIVDKPSEDIISEIDLKAKGIISIAHLEKENGRDWNMVWCNPKRIYFQCLSPNGSSGSLIRTFFPGQHKLSSAYTLKGVNTVSADTKGDLWGWENGRLTNFGIVIPN